MELQFDQLRSSLEKVHAEQVETLTGKMNADKSQELENLKSLLALEHTKDRSALQEEFDLKISEITQTNERALAELLSECLIYSGHTLQIYLVFIYSITIV